MQIPQLPQPSPTAIRRNHQSASRGSRLLVVYLIILVVVITSLTVAVSGRNWHHEHMTAPYPASASETTPANLMDGNLTKDSEEEGAPASPREEPHDSIGDDVIVRIER